MSGESDTTVVATNGSLVVPAGAVAAGTAVDAVAVEVPAELKVEGIEPGSEALAVSATSPTGQAIAVASSPMTIGLEIGDAGGASLVEESSLCVAAVVQLKDGAPSTLIAPGAPLARSIA